jgi:preprotein translocase subunit SecD
MLKIKELPSWIVAGYLSMMILGMLFLIPNGFGEKPAIECTRCSAEVIQNLQESYPSLELAPSLGEKSIFITDDIDLQLSIFQSMRKKYPNQKFNLNMISQSPSWLSGMGFKPMKLGLDLRGGVHFVLGVDIDSVLLKKQEAFLDHLRSFALSQKHKIQWVPKGDGKAQLVFPSREILSEYLVKIEQQFPQQQFLHALDQDALDVSMHPLYETQEYLRLMQTTLQSLEKRVNELGVGEASLYIQGNNQIVVDLPGIQDIQQAKRMLGKTATIDFYLVAHTQWTPGNPVPLGVSLKYRDNGQPLFLQKRPVLTGDAIIFAQSMQTPEGNPAVDLRITFDKARSFREFTSSHIGEAMAVMYKETYTNEYWNEETQSFDSKVAVDEKVLSVATIMNALGDRFQITGLNQKDSFELALMLRAGSLPAPIRIMEEKILGPSMGAENIAMGIKALACGLGLIFAFMIGYYRTLGVVASIVLLSNLLFMIMILAMIQATLTLTGIAGIILTLGMAVDANVLIFERMRDEIHKGSCVWTALDEGVDRASDTIIDSNITTMIIGIVLFFMGSGLIKGFAITLMIGLMTSMFTSMMGTKVFLHLIYSNQDRPQLIFSDKGASS